MADSDKVSRAITDSFQSFENSDDGDNVVSGLLLIAKAITGGARDIGNGDAATHMGGLEAHGMATKEGLFAIAVSLDGVAEALNRLAEAAEGRP